MEKHFDVCCVGQACTDIFIRNVDAVDYSHMQFVEEATMSIGGCALNVSVGLSRLGFKSALIAKVGWDAFGEFLQKTLAESGVDISGVHKDKNDTSSMSVGLIASDGERSLLHHPGTNATFCFEDVDLSILDASKIVFIGGSLALDRFDGEDAAKVLEYAQSKGCITIMDSSWDYSGQWMKNIAPCLPHLDWFVPSIEEAEQMLGTRDQVKLADELIRLGAKNVVLKKGVNGVYVQCADGSSFEKGIYQVNCVNAAGAGDAWCAGFMAGLLKELSIKECAMLGAANSAHCIQEMSTTSGIRSYEETLEFMRREPCILI